MTTNNLQGAGAKFADLSKIMAKRGVEAVTICRGDPCWDQWRFWRMSNGLGTTFMDSRGKWGVPSYYPPAGGLDTTLAEYTSGTARKGLEK